MLSEEWSVNSEHQSQHERSHNEERIKAFIQSLSNQSNLIRWLWRLFHRTKMTLPRMNILSPNNNKVDFQPTTTTATASAAAKPLTGHTAMSNCDSSLLMLSIVIALLLTIAAIGPVDGASGLTSDRKSLQTRRHILSLPFEPDSDYDDPAAVQNLPLTGLGSRYLLGRSNGSSVMRKPKFLPSTTSTTTTSTTSTTERTIYTFDISDLSLDDSSSNELSDHDSTPVSSSVTDSYPQTTVFQTQYITGRTTGSTNMSDMVAKNESDRLYREFIARLKEMHAVDVIVTLVGSVLALLTIFGNILVVVAFKIDRSLQTLSNYFLISLAFADFLIGCISMPLSLIYMLAKGWFLGPNVCDFWLSFDYLNSNSSVLNLLLISFDRYFSVLTPLSYRAIRSRGRIVLAIVVAWTLSSLLWPPWILAWSTIEGRRTVPDHMCYIPFLESNPGVTVVTAIAAFWLPVSIMIYLYFCIYIETERRYHDLNRLEKIAYSGTGSTPSTNTMPTRKFRIFRKKNTSPPTNGLRNCGPAGYTAALPPGMVQYNSSAFGAVSAGGVQQHLPNCPRTLKKLIRQTSGDPKNKTPNSKGVSSNKSSTRSDFPIELSKGISASGYPMPKLSKGPPIGNVNIFSTHDYANETIQLEQIGLLTDKSRTAMTKGQPVTGSSSTSRQLSFTTRDTSARRSWWSRLGWCKRSFETSLPPAAPFNKADCPGCVRRHRLRKVRQGVRYRAEQALKEKLEQETSKQIYTIVINLPQESPNSSESYSSDIKPTVRMLYDPETSKPFKSKRSRPVSARMPDISETDSDDSELSPYVDSDDDDNATNVFNNTNHQQQHQQQTSTSPMSRQPKSVPETNGGKHHDTNNNPRQRTSHNGQNNDNGSGPASVVDSSEPRPCNLLCFICCFFCRCRRQPEAHRNSSASVITTTARAYLRANISIKSERKAAKMLSAILLTFIITWTPYNVIVIIKTFKPDMIDSEGFLWQISYYLCYINSTINPICYAMCNKNFRHTYMQILTCRFSSRRRAPILANATRGAAATGVIDPPTVSRQLDERRRQQRFQ